MDDIKVLVVSANAFSKTANNGKTLESMFQAFKRDQIAQLFTRPLKAGLNDYTFAASYYTVTEADIINRLLLRSSSCGDVLNPDTVNSHFENTYSRDASKLSSINAGISGFLRACLWKTDIWKTRKLRDWIDEINPDLVFAVLGRQGFLYEITRYISSYKGIPFAVFYTDDYILHSQQSSLNRKRMLTNYKWAITHSSKCFCIGELMAKEYSSFFEKDFYPIMNSIVILPYEEKITDNSSIDISYFGSLSLNRFEMILRFSELFDSRVRINVYTGSEVTDKMKDALKGHNVFIRGFVEENEIRDKMRESDFLLHVESDDLNTKSITSLSVSTKIPEYLSSGRMVIGYGPTDIASMRLLEDYNVGLVLSSDSDNKSIIAKLKPYLDNSLLREIYGKKGYDFACKYFNNKFVASSFKAELLSIVSTSYGH